MKRYGNLWSDLIAFPNLVAAAKQAQRGKRYQQNVLQFNYSLEDQLTRLQTELQSQTYQPGAYHTFEIFEPKPRMISAAPYRDRVVHHALCNIITPIFERTFIPTSYANRVGFGSHRALKQFTHYTRTSSHVLLCDIRKYFPNIDHAILKALIRRKIKCPQTLWLIDTIIDNSNPQEPTLDYFPADSLLSPLQHRRGLPIGNLTSQFFANIYLNGFDHFIKETLKVAKYLRYMDDFALFSNDPQFLAQARSELEAYLDTLRLKIHPIKSQLFATQQGASFVGFRVIPTDQTTPKPVRIRIASRTLRRVKRRIRLLKKEYTFGGISLERIHQSMQSWSAHFNHGDTWHLQNQLFSPLDI